MPDVALMEQSLLGSLEATFGDLKFSLIELLRHAETVCPNQPAILEPGRESMTYRGLLHLAEKTIRTLNGLGLASHSRVAVALPSTADAAAAYLSVMSGMTIIPVAPGLPAGEYERYLRHARAAAVLVRHGLPSEARRAGHALDIPALDLVYSGHGPVGEFSIMGAGDFSGLEPGFALPGDTAFVLPTSGTTSLPKLVPRTQRHLALIAYFGHTLFHLADTRYALFSILPLHHASGFSPLLRSVAGRVGFACSHASNLSQVYNYLALQRPATLLVVPSVLETLVSEAPRYEHLLKENALRRLTVVSAALPEPLLLKAQRIFGVSVQVLYGMTEINTISSLTRDPGSASRGPGSVGQPLPFCEVKIADEDGEPALASTTGEILVRSPLMFAGYENDPQASAEAFRDGWFRTGDTGHLDADGYLYLTGRVKEMINRGGSKVSPFDVDAVLIQHPGVAEAATFGFPHSALGEDVAAAVVVTGQGITERELRSFAAGRLASYKVPSRFVFVSEIPKTPLGKTRRLLLAERFRAELER
jgi:acyl-CoA synthetase (AMP-forming)/AMP-acid ligase II